ncbi:hypothetical protein IEQ34_009399 [Dendrobium chrysotoxum]|uniref:Uncharacterized protein n=1 Tax=Dendrobium chrysotoxum TaxID=161865 RepID=A0AAV7H2C5_DENCH|nr:hypothetical protein IEQ34_009399 [Dendrobium chrysotoxum]
MIGAARVGDEGEATASSICIKTSRELRVTGVAGKLKLCLIHENKRREVCQFVKRSKARPRLLAPNCLLKEQGRVRALFFLVSHRSPVFIPVQLISYVGLVT